MFKKTSRKLICIIVAAAILLAVVPIVFAANNPVVKSDKSIARTYETVNFNITTSSDVRKIQTVIDGVTGNTYTKYVQKKGQRYWKVSIKFTRTGKRNVKFNAYTSGGKTAIPKNGCTIDVIKEYDITRPAAAPVTGSAAYFTVSTPKSVASLSYIIDGVTYAKVTKYQKQSGAYRIWRVPLTFSKPGNRAVYFAAYSAKGSRLKKFPASPLYVSVAEGAPKITSFKAADAQVAPLLEGNPRFSVNMANQMALTLGVYDGSGNLAAMLASGLQASGVKQFTWDVIDDTTRTLTAATGKYTLKLHAANSAGETDLQIPISLINPVEPDTATLQPFVVAFDMASLQGKLQDDGNVPVDDAGFYIGSSAGSLTTKVSFGSAKEGAQFKKLMPGLTPDATYYYCAYAVNEGGLEDKGDVLSFTTPSQSVFTAQDSFFDTAAEESLYIFNSTNSKYTSDKPPAGYGSSAEAALHMQTITFPVWKYSGGQYTASTATIKIHRKLAEAAKAIFAEVYALKTKFPIVSVSSFNYREIRGPSACSTLSEHSFGCAIDINPSYNPNVVSGDPRDPNSPFTVPKSVAAIFQKYGWDWGGNWSSNKDYMHFEYLGTPVAGKPVASSSK